jgi:hypothetical protein
VLVGLQQDCCQLVQQLQEAEGDENGSSGSGVIGRLHAVAEEDEEEQQQQQQQQHAELGGEGQRHGKQQQAEGLAGSKGDKKVGICFKKASL